MPSSTFRAFWRSEDASRVPGYADPDAPAIMFGTRTHAGLANMH
jgi:hypothetical protein